MTFGKGQLVSKKQAIGLAVLACVQNSLAGGLLYGWPSIDRTLLGNEGAGLSYDETTTIFSWASSIGLVSTLVLGILLDRYGPRLCSVLSLLLVAFGCFLFASANNFSSFAIATCIISFGGPGIQISVIHVAKLFPENKFLVLSFLNGTIAFSFGVFGIFDGLWQNIEPLSFRTLFGAYGLVVIALMATSAVFWPDVLHEQSVSLESDKSEHTPEEFYYEAITSHHHLLQQSPNSSFRQDDVLHPLQRQDSFLISKKAMRSDLGKLVSLKDRPLFEQLLSGTFMRTLLVFIVTCFLANFYIASFSTEVADAQWFVDEQQHQVTCIFSFVMSTGVLGSIVAGWLMDTSGLDLCTALTIFLCQAHILILIFVSYSLLWMSFGFFIYVVFRQFLFPVYIASLTTRLGFKYFGLLNGIGFALSGITQLFMGKLVGFVKGNCHLAGVPLGECNHGHWLCLHVTEFVILCLLLLCPFYERLQDKARQREIKETFGNLRSFKKYGSQSLVEEKTSLQANNDE